MIGFLNSRCLIPEQVELLESPNSNLDLIYFEASVNEFNEEFLEIGFEGRLGSVIEIPI